MGGFKRRLMELEEIYGPAWAWNGDWNNPDFYPDADEGQLADQSATADPDEPDLDQVCADTEGPTANKH